MSELLRECPYRAKAGIRNPPPSNAETVLALSSLPSQPSRPTQLHWIPADTIGGRHVILAIGWILFAFVVERASKIQAEELTFDPFKILGVASVRSYSLVLG